GLIEHQDFAYAGNGDGLKLRDGGQDGELGGSEAGRFETEVIKASDGASSAAKVESGTRAGAGEVERIGGSTLDLHIHVKYKWSQIGVKRVFSAGKFWEFPADFKHGRRKLRGEPCRCR